MVVDGDTATAALPLGHIQVLHNLCVILATPTSVAAVVVVAVVVVSVVVVFFVTAPLVVLIKILLQLLWHCFAVYLYFFSCQSLFMILC